MVDLTIARQQILALRQARGWNQTELATRAGVPQNTLSQIETGLCAPSLKTAGKLADALGVTLDTLLTAPEAVQSAA